MGILQAGEDRLLAARKADGTMPLWRGLMEPCGPSAWMQTGSPGHQRQWSESWIREHNDSRPHGERTPHEFARQMPETNSGTVTEKGDRSVHRRSHIWT